MTRTALHRTLRAATRFVLLVAALLSGGYVAQRAAEHPPTALAAAAVLAVAVGLVFLNLYLDARLEQKGHHHG